ncbi:MAG: FMN-binding glutamate synthase family protein [Sneathiellaceae bacterium]
MTQRAVFYYISVIGVIAVGVAGGAWPWVFWLLIPMALYIAIGLYDIHVSRANVLANYPVIGHLRYMFEFVRPEIQQYFIATNLSGRPFNREQRDLVYHRAEHSLDTLPFGTQQDIYDIGYESTVHSLSPKKLSEEDGRTTVGGPDCKHPYNASRLNISAMSFGALSQNAIMAMNRGAKLGGFAHNTGEGGLSPYHLEHGGDIIWQIGTGYFGCRTKDGGFDADEFRKKAALAQVKMIEIKLSQGAKPSHGGILPAAKVSEEISRIRGIPMGEDCISPPAHTQFATPKALLEFVARLRELSGGKPVGFKLCIGVKSEFMSICKAMLETGITPDFITVDGAEGGTGAAPVEFTDYMGLPINEGLAFVHSCLVGVNLRNRMHVIASGKVTNGFDMVTKLSLGADMCNAARAMMFAVGCIQALRCNDNTCPTGVATQDRNRGRALDVPTKSVGVKNYHNATVESFLDLCGAMGIEHPDRLGPDHIFRRVENETMKTYSEIYPYLQPGELLGDQVNAGYARDWAKASAAAF